MKQSDPNLPSISDQRSAQISVFNIAVRYVSSDVDSLKKQDAPTTEIAVASLVESYLEAKIANLTREKLIESQLSI